MSEAVKASTTPCKAKEVPINPRFYAFEGRHGFFSACPLELAGNFCRCATKWLLKLWARAIISHAHVGAHALTLHHRTDSVNHGVRLGEPFDGLEGT